MTTVYKQFIAPMTMLNRRVQEAMLKRSLGPKEADDLVAMVFERADIEVGLAMANMATMCENGKSVATNLQVMRGLKQLDNCSRTVVFPVEFLVRIRQDIDALNRLIKDANNKESENA